MTSTEQAGSVTEAEAAFRRISEAEWQERVADLGDQTLAGDSVDELLPDVSGEAWVARGTRWRAVLAELEGIDASELSDRARVDLAVYVDQLQTLVAQVDHRMHERPANADSAFWTDHTHRARRSTWTLEDAQRYAQQLGSTSRWIGQHIANMRAGLDRGFGPARVSMIGRQEPVRSIAEATDPRETPFFSPFTSLPASVPDAKAKQLADRAAAVIGASVIPAYKTLLAFLEDEYLPALPEAIAAVDGPDGEAFYRAQLREYSTTDMTPQEIHELGLAEVASILAEMREIAHETGFDGDVDRLIAHLRTNERFYAPTREQLLKEAAWVCKRFDGVVHRWFGRTPRQRFGIIEPPADLAPFYTFGRGGLESYTLNTYNLPARPLYSLPALTLHESAPGHCFQIALAHEDERMPAYRRRVYISAYGEGWALYTERLGVEMGIYETPFERMGMLSFQMWRAVRLVIDPGMHALGWSRERAQAFLRDHTAIAEHEIVTEVDRYIAWPGQATAYHIGQLTILRLRARAEGALGAAFDIRAFHDLVLGLGSVPLMVLESEVDRAIARWQEEASEIQR